MPVETTVVGTMQRPQHVGAFQVRHHAFDLWLTYDSRIVDSQRVLELQSLLTTLQILGSSRHAQHSDAPQRQLPLFLKAKEELAGADPNFDVDRPQSLYVVDARGAAGRARGRSGLVDEQHRLCAELCGASRGAAARGPGSNNDNSWE